MNEVKLDYLTIGGKEIPITRAEIHQNKLQYYPENPRIYSLFNFDVGTPTQQEIEEKMLEQDHVNTLIQSIKSNGGLLEPLIVRDGEFIVLEGNSRLAAYRKLYQTDSIRWAKIKCVLLPETIDADSVFALLGQYHIISRKDWSPYEQAGYLWRRKIHYNVSVEAMTKDVGLSRHIINGLIEVYDFMQNCGDKYPQHWSHYQEYLRSGSISQMRKKNPDLDAVIINQIKTSAINAVEIRDKLAKIGKVNGQQGEKIVKSFISGKKSLDEAFHIAEMCGVTNSQYLQLNKFRNYIVMPDTKKTILRLEKGQLKKCNYELNKISTAISKILAAIDEYDEDDLGD